MGVGSGGGDWTTKANIYIINITEDYTFQALNPGMFSITLNPEETVEGELIFMPTEVRVNFSVYQFNISMSGY